MSGEYRPSVGDRVQFTEYARSQRFHNGSADGRKRMRVEAVLRYDDVQLDSGEIWNACWLERVNE